MRYAWTKQAPIYIVCTHTYDYVCVRPILFTVLKSRISDHHIDGNASKPRISKMHNVQETQITVSKQARNRVFATFIFQGLYSNIVCKETSKLIKLHFY